MTRVASKHVRRIGSVWAIMTVLFACAGSDDHSLRPGTDSRERTQADGGDRASDGSVETSTDASVDAADPSTPDSGDGRECTTPCRMGRTCCGGACVSLYNDPFNCGACGVVCGGATPACEGQVCKAPPCYRGAACGAADTCCGEECCGPGQICCITEGGSTVSRTCITPSPSQPTCPEGCAGLGCDSDRDIKQDVAPVDERAVLEAVSRMPVSTWAYKDDPRTRHLGPMAQDFKAAFGVGATERAYDPIDAHGIAFASIKALYQMNAVQSARLERLERENRELRERLLSRRHPSVRGR